MHVCRLTLAAAVIALLLVLSGCSEDGENSQIDGDSSEPDYEYSDGDSFEEDEKSDGDDEESAAEDGELEVDIEPENEIEIGAETDFEIEVEHEIPSVEQISAMTFNLRNGIASDGLNSWINRRTIVTNLIVQEKPDIIGVQEAWKFQIDFIAENVPGYEWVGISRSIEELDEYCAVFYRSDMFALLDSGTFWLSDTPEISQSLFSENQLCPRIVTWAELECRASGMVYFVFNTHFDTTSKDEVPEKSAALTVRKLEEITAGRPALLMGDFNQHVGSNAYLILTGAMEYDGVSGNLADPWLILGLAEEGTYHRFTGVASSTSRIDWILSTSEFQPLSGRVLHYEEDGFFPSDHFPVVTVFDLPVSATRQ